LGVLVAITTNSGQSEWAAQSWDPRSQNWLFYSSDNRCSLDEIMKCAQAPENFKYDRSWKSVGAKEGKNYVIFTIERPFSHTSSDRILRMDDIREMKVGFVSGLWASYGFSNYMNLCLSAEGDRRECGSSASFEIPDPAPVAPVTPPA